MQEIRLIMSSGPDILYTLTDKEFELYLQDTIVERCEQDSINPDDIIRIETVIEEGA